MAALADLSLFVLGVGFSFLAGMATAVGALPVLAVPRMSPRLQDMMLGFGAGVMLSASFFSLILPALAAATPIAPSPAGPPPRSSPPALRLAPTACGSPTASRRISISSSATRGR